MENLSSFIYLVPIVVILFMGFFTVNQQTTAIVERFGKFISIRQSGLQFKIPIIDKISGRVSLKIQQLDVIVETKTLDDVFVKLKEKDRERVFGVPGIVRYVYWLQKPAIVRDDEIAIMKEWLSVETGAAKVESLRCGDRMRISSGVFEGEEGVVEEVNKSRVQLLLVDLGMKITLKRSVINLS